jgi:ABC-type sugar transport system ATPase subunit
MRRQRLLEITGLSKSYGPNRVLAEVDSHLEAGESVAIIGENGAGKVKLLPENMYLKDTSILQKFGNVEGL